MRVTITLSNSCQPTMHREGCAHLGRIRNRSNYEAEYVVDVATIVEASLDYWTDIIHSDNGLKGQAALDLAEEYLSEFEIGPCLKSLPLK